jgi:hypothetical protein
LHLDLFCASFVSFAFMFCSMFLYFCSSQYPLFFCVSTWFVSSR